MPTYRTGYGDTRRTLEGLRAWPPFAMLHPEVQRRTIALMDHSHANGRDLGIGGAGRTSAQQLAVFLERHNPVASGGCCGYNGKRYALKPGAAHAAPPGRSFHEETVDGRWAVAIDWVGWEDGWAETQWAAFGLVSAKDWSVKEPWHTQPVEFPRARRDYDPAVHQLTVWPLDDKDDDMPDDVNRRAYDSRGAGQLQLQAGVPRRIAVTFDGGERRATCTFHVIPASGDGGFLRVWTPGDTEPDTAVLAWPNGSAGKVLSAVWSCDVVDREVMVKSSTSVDLMIDTQAVW